MFPRNLENQSKKLKKLILRVKGQYYGVDDVANHLKFYKELLANMAKENHQFDSVYLNIQKGCYEYNEAQHLISYSHICEFVVGIVLKQSHHVICSYLDGKHIKNCLNKLKFGIKSNVNAIEHFNGHMHKWKLFKHSKGEIVVELLSSG